MKKSTQSPFERMQKGAAILLSVLLFMAWSCEKSDKYDVYENHDISVCGVNDPLQNTEWLKEYCENIKDKKYDYPQSALL